MCSVAHVAAGALIGSVLDSRLAALAIGLASHIPLDIIPHIDFKDFRIDAVVTIGLLGGILVVSGLSPVFFGALGAVAPDFENLLWNTGIIREKDKIFPTHSGLLRHGQAKASSGATTEIIMSVFSVGIVAVAVLLGGSN